MSIRRLQQILTNEPAFAELVARREREAKLYVQVRRALPVVLADHVRVADGLTEELVLVTASGAAAGLVRQQTPRILGALMGAGLKFTGIRVRVQPRPTLPMTRKPIAKQLDTAVALKLLALAGTLSDPPLSAALRRLAGNAVGARHAMATRRSKA
jgi:hypothetical protein